MLCLTSISNRLTWTAACWFCCFTICVGQTDKPKSDKKAKQATMKEFLSYQKVVNSTAMMTSNPEAMFLAGRYGLQVLPLTWEDTGRFKNSSVGDNISDLTIQVQTQNPKSEEYELHCMPVIRYPNFSDKTADIPPDRFFLLVGNEKGKELQKISLKQFLEEPRKYLTKAESWAGKGKSLWAPRDKYVLVSAQACFLPVPEKADYKAEFNPVLFNYQSSEKNPAVLTLVATREGTSVTIIDNVRDRFEAGFTWGQRLFFNDHGQRASFTGERLSEFKAKQEAGLELPTPQAVNEKGLNLALLIQIPLKHKPLKDLGGFGMGGGGGGGFFGGGGIGLNGAMGGAGGMGGGFGGGGAFMPQSNVEEAVIGHGEVDGPYTEIDNLEIERDTRFPVRVTVQFYKATSNGVVNAADLEEIAGSIQRVYADADFVGSLVVDGDTNRPTEHDGPKIQPQWWWDSFWDRYEKNTKMTRQQALQNLHSRLGYGWVPRSRQELIHELRSGK